MCANKLVDKLKTKGDFGAASGIFSGAFLKDAFPLCSSDQSPVKSGYESDVKDSESRGDARRLLSSDIS